MKLQKIYNGLCIPALIIHELFHYVFIKLTFAKYTFTVVDFDEDYEITGNLSVKVCYIPSNYFQVLLISLSPILGLFFWLLPIFFGFGVLSIISIFYTILCFKIIIPSKEDINVIKQKRSSI